jgi:hypothetical protein
MGRSGRSGMGRLRGLYRGCFEGRGPVINKNPWCSILFKYRQYLKLNPLTIQIFRSVRPILNMRSVYVCSSRRF